jgi:hypothetical protein
MPLSLRTLPRRYQARHLQLDRRILARTLDPFHAEGGRGVAAEEPGVARGVDGDRVGARAGGVDGLWGRCRENRGCCGVVRGGRGS